MRVNDSEYILLTPEQKDRVTWIDIVDPEKAPGFIDIIPAGKANWAKWLGDFEEYPGEAESRGVTERGFNKP